MKSSHSMKPTTLKVRMISLIGILLGSQVLLASVAITKSKSIMGHLNYVTEAQLPATQQATLVDMFHDGLRAKVFEALYDDAKHQDTGIDELLTDTKEMAKKFNETFESLAKLPLSEKTRADIKKNNELANDYASAATLIVESTKAGNHEKIVKAMPIFFGLFKTLEGNLENLEKQILAEASGQSNDGADIVTQVVWLSVAGFLLSSISGIAIYVWTKRSFDEVIVSATRATHSIEEISVQLEAESTKVKEASVEQAAAIQQSVSSLAEMGSMITQTAENVKLSLETTQSALARTDEGKQIMERLSHSMTAIQKSNAQLQDLQKVIEDIHNKTAVINDIVFKTQLLSFNASIEAARAGQHGRGFAVVAEEVGSLAELSGQASKDIELLLASSQINVKETLEMTQSRVGDGTRVGQLALQAFEEIAGSISQINQQVRSINDATQQQEIGIQQTNSAMKQMDITSQANSTSSSVALEKASALSHKSQNLSHNMTQLVALISGQNDSGNHFQDSEIESHQHSHDVGAPIGDHNLVAKLALKNRSLKLKDTHHNDVSADNSDFKKAA